MDERNPDLHMGDAPALMFIPSPLPPDVKIPGNQILMIGSLPLYLFVRDLVIADQSARRLQHQRNDDAIAKMMEALLQYKASGVSPTESTFSNPTTFDIAKWMDSDGRTVEDTNEDTNEDAEL